MENFFDFIFNHYFRAVMSRQEDMGFVHGLACQCRCGLLTGLMFKWLLQLEERVLKLLEDLGFIGIICFPKNLTCGGHCFLNEMHAKYQKAWQLLAFIFDRY
jgi:hypothetical protein